MALPEERGIKLDLELVRKEEEMNLNFKDPNDIFLFVCLIVALIAIFVFCVIRAIKRLDAHIKERNSLPAEYRLRLADGSIVILERVWIDDELRCALKIPFPPLLAASLALEAEKERLRNTPTPLALKGGRALDPLGPDQGGPVQPAEPRDYDFNEVEKMRF